MYPSGPSVSLQASHSGMTHQGRDSPECSGDDLHAGWPCASLRVREQRGRAWGPPPGRGGPGALQQPEPGLCPDTQNQETHRELAAGRKPQWRKKPEAPLGAEVSGGPGVRAAVPGERGLAGTHSSTAGLAEGAWRAGHMRAPRSRLLQGRHLSQKQAWTLRPPAPVNAPCPRRSLCWRRELSQERGKFQTKPATRRRDWCLRKPPSSRRPQSPRYSQPQAGPWPH